MVQVVADRRSCSYLARQLAAGSTYKVVARFKASSRGGATAATAAVCDVSSLTQPHSFLITTTPIRQSSIADAVDDAS